jgi:hypothetical protein
MPTLALSRRSCLALPLLSLARAAPALDAPSGTVVLTISGKVQGERAQFDMAMLEKLPQHSFTTKTPWYAQPRKFTGPLLRDVLAAAGVNIAPETPSASAPTGHEEARSRGPRGAIDLGRPGTDRARLLKAVALNDYKVDIPADDAKAYDVVVARLMDDKPMPVRDKGPLFIIYPFDARPELRNTIYYSRCAWQLKAIEVL